ncbi:hypothetical protein SEA_ZOOMAN_327 [Microbacterium phage Zooman]|nr:hypothetical protein SEA_ZOOMAN_327 [Microbacterium phage Zooman]
MVRETRDSGDADRSDWERAVAQVFDSEEYAPRQWEGNADAVIESDTCPWIQDAEGNVFDFGGDGMRELHASGVLVGRTYIQRDDLAGWQDSFTDLHAALVAAKMVEHITGRPHFVWYNGA